MNCWKGDRNHFGTNEPFAKVKLSNALALEHICMQNLGPQNTHNKELIEDMEKNYNISWLQHCDSLNY